MTWRPFGAAFLWGTAGPSVGEPVRPTTNRRRRHGERFDRSPVQTRHPELVSGSTGPQGNGWRLGPRPPPRGGPRNKSGVTRKVTDADRPSATPHALRGSCRQRQFRQIRSPPCRTPSVQLVSGSTGPRWNGWRLKPRSPPQDGRRNTSELTKMVRDAGLDATPHASRRKCRHDRRSTIHRPHVQRSRYFTRRAVRIVTLVTGTSPLNAPRSVAVGETGASNTFRIVSCP